jgi:hypothetical protein
MRSSKYTRELLAPAVAHSTSLADVIRAVGLRPTGGNHRFISARIRILGLDTSHFGWSKLRKQIYKVPEAELRRLVANASSVAQVLQRLGLPDQGRAHHELTTRIRKLAIETSHMSGARWSKGHTSSTHASVARGAQKRSLADADVFIECSPLINDGPALTKRLLALGWEYRCSACRIVEWQGQRLVLHLDHINGIANDNRLENLRFLCPNCHSQTDTYCNKKRPLRASDGPSHYAYSCYMEVTRAWRNWWTRWT